ncbi:MAG: pilus assembly protein [Chloroflexi bacterium]|nr:pilus assembly protein [Chloroflexota bacterium]
MRAILKKILQILDGTPAVYGKRQAGQSMVELALVTPLLIILLAGLVEIGWFANNYLIILDVTRAGARRATALVDQQSPVSESWIPEYSFVPQSWLTDPGDSDYHMPYTAAELALPSEVPPKAVDYYRELYRWNAADAAAGTGACVASAVDRLFYNEVVCTMLVSLEPLTLKQENNIDDIIVTGYSVENVDPRDFSGWLPADRPLTGDVPQLVVVGRYPPEANECDVTESAPGVYSVTPRESRDPFDLNDNGWYDVQETVKNIDGANDFTEHGELAYLDPVAGSLAAAEKQVGFTLFGNHRIPGTRCTGSEWTMRQVENLVNLPQYAIDDLDARTMIPGMGIALVEMYWEHEMLLKIPVLSPVFTAVGNSEGKMVIYVWAAFPLPAVEPFIIFPEP